MHTQATGYTQANGHTGRCDSHTGMYTKICTQADVICTQEMHTPGYAHEGSVDTGRCSGGVSYVVF